jgi:hypothetical protein
MPRETRPWLTPSLSPVVEAWSTQHYERKAESYGLVRLVGCQPASSAFLSHHFSTNHQPLASQQYFSLIINQHQPSAISHQPTNEAYS